MAKLTADFPHFADLDKAGEATEAKIRKRIAEGTLTQIRGIGPSAAADIEAAFEESDSPDAQAGDMIESENDESRTPATDAESLGDQTSGDQTGDDKTNADESLDEEEDKVDSALINDGTISSETLNNAKAEGDKPGAQKNDEMANHALDQPTTAEATLGQKAASEGERIALSGSVFVDDPAGAYVSKTAVHLPQEGGRIKVLPIGQMAPRHGMEVRDGEDVYAIQEALAPDATSMDWLRVRSPNTGKPFVD